MPLINCINLWYICYTFEFYCKYDRRNYSMDSIQQNQSPHHSSSTAEGAVTHVSHQWPRERQQRIKVMMMMIHVNLYHTQFYMLFITCLRYRNYNTHTHTDTDTQTHRRRKQKTRPKKRKRFDPVSSKMGINNQNTTSSSNTHKGWLASLNHNDCGKESWSVDKKSEKALTLQYILVCSPLTFGIRSHDNTGEWRDPAARMHSKQFPMSTKKPSFSYPG